MDGYYNTFTNSRILSPMNIKFTDDSIRNLTAIKPITKHIFLHGHIIYAHYPHAKSKLWITCVQVLCYTIYMKKMFDKTRPLSWSAISSFEYDPEQWYRKYVLNQKDDETKEMMFGKALATALEKGTCDIPDLVKKLPHTKEHPFKVMFGKIPLIGFADDFDNKTFTSLNEVKTGKKPWTQKRVDEHGQFDMYLLMNYITNKVKPEDVDCMLHWLPTQENGDFSISFVNPITVYSFSTKRTMQDILNFGSKINTIYKEMEKYCQNHE